MMAVGGERRAEGGGRNGGASRITESWRVAGMRPVDGGWDEKEGSEEAEQALESVVLVTAANLAWGVSRGQETKRCSSEEKPWESCLACVSRVSVSCVCVLCVVCVQVTRTCFSLPECDTEAEAQHWTLSRAVAVGKNASWWRRFRFSRYWLAHEVVGTGRFIVDVNMYIVRGQ